MGGEKGNYEKMVVHVLQIIVVIAPALKKKFF